MGTPVDEDDDAERDHDRDLHEDRQTDGLRGRLDAAHRQRDGAGGQYQRQWLPRYEQRGVVGEGQRHHATRHREDPRDGHRIAHHDQQGRDDTDPRSQRGLDVGYDASRRGLHLGELGHRESEQDSRHACSEDRQRGCDTGGEGNHPEREVEVFPQADVGECRGRQIRRAELTGPEVLCALAHYRPLGLLGLKDDARRDSACLDIGDRVLPERAVDRVAHHLLLDAKRLPAGDAVITAAARVAEPWHRYAVTDRDLAHGLVACAVALVICAVLNDSAGVASTAGALVAMRLRDGSETNCLATAPG